MSGLGDFIEFRESICTPLAVQEVEAAGLFVN